MSFVSCKNYTFVVRHETKWSAVVVVINDANATPLCSVAYYEHRSCYMCIGGAGFPAPPLRFLLVVRKPKLTYRNYG